MKLGLGSVQFGMPYGLSQHKQAKTCDVEAILSFAKRHEVSVIDTSTAYGESEIILGQQGDLEFFKIVTKTPSFKKNNLSKTDAAELYQACLNSLQKLRIPKLHGLLVHHEADLLATGGGYLFESMKKLQQKGFVDKVGVSVYSPETLERILKDFSIDIVQLPLNIFDQRFLQAGILRSLKNKGVEIHARSLFLQGLLLKQFFELPQYFKTFSNYFDRYAHFLSTMKVSALEATLGFVKAIPEVDVMLVGVRSVSQLTETFENYEKANRDVSLFEPLACKDDLLVDPRKWHL